MFDYLNYKNKIPLSKVLVGKIPNLNPYSVKYKNFWRECKRKIIEGYWVNHEENYQWVPPLLALYNNFWTIEMKIKGVKSQNKSKGTPRLRDIEWIKGYVHAAARGFSGFEKDTEYSCNRILIDPNREENIPFLEDYVRESIYKPNGELKEYVPALEYLYKYKTCELGKPQFFNWAKNNVDIECRNIGKSMISGAMVAHNFLTDGAMDYDEMLEMQANGTNFTSETLVGAIDSKYSGGLITKLQFGLDNLPGSIELGKDMFPPPLAKKYSGSFMSGKQVIALYEKKVGNNWIKVGSQSKILHRSFGDNEFAANGTRPGYSVLDEIGFFNILEEALGQMAECTTTDGKKFGTIWMTGTGGDMEGGSTESVKRVFYSPASYDCLEFDDIFEGKGKIGFFVPAWMALDDFRDELGNVNRELATRTLMKEREKAANAKSKKPLYDLLQMKPLVPSEAFLVLSGNIFPVAELKQHLGFLESNDKFKNTGITGVMLRNKEGKAEFKAEDLIACDYPTPKGVDTTGCVVIWEEPIENPPFGLYIAGIDPYDQDKAENSSSLGSVFIYKRFMNTDQTYHLPVAEYTARPEFANDFYETSRRLLEYYNAQALYENEKTGLKSYFETKHVLHLLHRQPQIIKSISPNSKVDRNYGTHMTIQIKNAIEIYLRDWLKTEIEPGIMQLTKINSLPLLRELISYNDTGNFDRVISFMLCIMQDLEMHKIVVEETKKELDIDPFFQRALFRN